VTPYPYDPIGDDGSPFGCLEYGSIVVLAVATIALAAWYLAEAAVKFL
jgi:hypothetical protein